MTPATAVFCPTRVMIKKRGGTKVESHRARERCRRRIGLLGGSFNPAHDGHLHISVAALRRLGLDEVWWLVSPQNPLKPEAGMAALDDRVAAAKKLARNPRIRVSDIERRLGTRFTVDTLRALRQRHRDHAFVWLMGADNLVQLPAWRNWQEIFETTAVAVFARPSYSLKALAGQAATRFARCRVSEATAQRLAGRTTPAWVYLRVQLHPASSTSIRAARAKRKARH